MRESILQYPAIRTGIDEQFKLLNHLGLTADELEETLAKPEYETVERAYDLQSRQQKSIAQVVERVTGFGTDMGSMFESCVLTLGRVPTQREFSDSCLPVAKEFWDKAVPEGIAWDETVEAAVTNRNYRCYISQVVEIHLQLMLRELFPDWVIASSDAMDMLMGVDLVVETENKRLFLHVFKNSRYSFMAFRKKKSRGGMRDQTGKFRKYRRDFDGDKTLVYDGKPESCSESTKFINGIPLFKADWVGTKLMLFDKLPQFGEELADSKKLGYLEDYLQKYKENSGGKE